MIKYNILVSIAIIFLILPLGSSVALYSDNSNKILFYKFNQGSGTSVIDQLGLFNGTYDYAPQWEASSWVGYQNASRHTTGLTLNTTFLGNASVQSNFTLEFRLNASDVSVGALVTWGSPSSNGFGLAYDGTSTFSWIISGGCNQTNGIGPGMTIGKRTYIVITRNDSNWNLYQDGVLVHNRTCTTTGFSDYNITFGKDPTNYFTTNYSGQVDQFILWDRPLNITEILFLNESTDDGQGNLVSLNAPANTTLFTSMPINFNISMTPAYTFNNTNLTINIWYANGTLFNRTTKIVLGQSINYTNFTIDNFISGSYFWGAYACFNSITTRSCTTASPNLTFSVLVLSSNSIYNASTYETARENFFANISISPGKTLSSANLIYKGSPYTATVTQIISTNYTVSRSIDIPIGEGLNTFFWNILYNDGTYQNTSAGGQTVAPINLSLCIGAPYNVVYMNFTFKNETVSQQIVPAVLSSTWSYYLGTGTINKTYSFSNSTENFAYPFCFAPQNRTMYAAPIISYSNSYSPQRSYSPGILTLTNSSTNQILYLLPSSDGQYVSFQVKTIGGSVIAGALIEISRSGLGLVEARTTDDSGIATFFLNPNIAYTIDTSASGYTSSTQTITPTQTSYTITLGGSSSASNSSIEDYSRGIIYKISPTINPLSNRTNYTFTFDITSSYWGLTSYGFNLTTANGTLLATASGSNSAGSVVTRSLNTGNNSFIYMNYFWFVGGNLTSGTRIWVVVDDSDTGTSIANFISDFQRYLNNSEDSDGLFGLSVNTSTGNFSLAIIIFLIIFSFAGIMSYRYGLTGEAAIGLLIFAGVLFFDVALGLIPAIAGIDNFITMFCGLVVIGLFLKEVVR